MLPTEPPSPPRPPAVTIAAWTQLLTAIILVATAVTGFAVKSALEDEILREVMTDPESPASQMAADSLRSVFMLSAIIHAVVNLIFAGLYFAFGMVNLKGSRVGRIRSWVLAGIGLLCCGLGGLGGVISDLPMTANGAEETQSLRDAMPVWLTVTDWISAFTFIVGSLLIIILLALPSSNDYFRKGPMAPFPPGNW